MRIDPKSWGRRAYRGLTRHAWAFILSSWTFCLVGTAGYGFFAGSFRPFHAAFLAAAALVGPLPAIVLWHEGGHALAGWARGIRINGLGLGRFSIGFVCVWGRGRLRFYRRGGMNAYICCRIPLNDLDRFILAAGGPGATALLGIVCLVGAAIFWWSHGHWNIFTGYCEYLWGYGAFHQQRDYIVPVVTWIGILGLNDSAENLKEIERPDGKGMFRSDGWHIRRILRKWRRKP